MKTIAIIAEYNPLHNGHIQHLQKAFFDSCQTFPNLQKVAIISGNFVQRGEPAICDKWLRTRMALLAGFDLVLELPLCYATASAENFAKGAISILDACGIIDSLCFGSELADIFTLKNYAKTSQSENFDAILQDNLKKGLSYPTAKTIAIEKTMSTEFPVAPNNVLGIEYIKALTAVNSKIVPYTVARSAGSAKTLRDSLKNGENVSDKMPTFAWKILNESIQNHGLPSLDNLSKIFHYKLRTNPTEFFADILDISEGLQNRLIKNAENNALISEIIATAKTKRYTFLRLQRAILHIILDVKKGYTPPQYIRILGFKKSQILKQLQQQAKLPIIINLSQQENLSSTAKTMLNAEIESTKIYGLAFDKNLQINEYKKSLVVLP
ncbi:MAG: nucleotidyltransferase family protein [Firmicutes bacterium]|nr:nucleotidyltransferase family protein [Bacillota bacterium]